MSARRFDPEALLADVLGSRTAVLGVLQVFAPWQASTQAELQAAAARGERERLRQLAHTIRGALLQLHAAEGVARARALEDCCADDSVSYAAAALALQDELRALDDEIRHWLALHAKSSGS